MYHAIVKKKLQKAFQQLNNGDYDPIIAQFGPEFEHVFPGNHALAGRRYTPESNVAWYKRLATIFPDLQFNVKNIVVNGWPWDTVASAEWEDSFTLRDGRKGNNQGVHVFHLRWGKVTSLHIYTDTQKLSNYCQELSLQGVLDATAVPIAD